LVADQVNQHLENDDDAAEEVAVPRINLEREANTMLCK